MRWVQVHPRLRRRVSSPDGAGQETTIATPDLYLLAGLVSAAMTCIAVAIAERRDTQRKQAGRVEEILEVTQIVDEAADRLVAVLERSGADRLQGSLTLRDLAHDAFDGAAVDIARRAFGSPAAKYDRLD